MYTCRNLSCLERFFVSESMASSAKTRGDFGERIAVRYLRARGFRIIARNYMLARGIKRGEIDIIAQRNGAIHFIEVKTRFTRGDNVVDPPEMQITHAKLRAMTRMAQRYIRMHGLEDVVYHLDAVAIVVCVERCGAMTARVRYMADIFLA